MSDTLAHLWGIIENRRLYPKEGSYTVSLFRKGVGEIAKKVGEEAVEVVVAALHESDERLVYETADLVYHVMVLLSAQGLSWEDVEAELRRRFDMGREELP